MKNLLCYLMIFLVVYLLGIWISVCYHEMTHAAINHHFGVSSTVFYNIHGGYTLAELNQSDAADLAKWEKALPYHMELEITSYNNNFLYFGIMFGCLMIGLSGHMLRGDRREK